MIGCRVAVPMVVLVLACAVGGALPAGAAAEQASEPASPAARGLDAGGFHSCAVLGAGSLRCWGLGLSGQLGYGNTETIGDDETPASIAPVSVGAGRTVKALAAGDFHTCAILDDGTVRCWGFGADGRLGYGNTDDVPDPSSVGPVNLSGHTATAITAGPAHTCVVLDDGSVRCWGFGGGGPGFPKDGRLGYGSTDNVGDTPATTPDKKGAVKLGAGSKAVAISAGGAHTCVILADGTVRCWGIGAYGQLGYGDTNDVGDKPTNTPDTVGPVNLGGHKATAISAGGLGVGVDAGNAGDAHTCVILDDASVRCWGYGADGQLGYGNTSNVGDKPTNTPDTAGPVNLGPGRTAVAVSAGQDHTCAVLDDHSVRCWGLATHGRLGYPTLDSFGNQPNVGATSTTTPDLVGPVDVGSGRTAVAISAGGQHTCARLDEGSVRCWGYGAYGQLGYCSTDSVGDDEPPGSVGPVNLQPSDGGAGCASPPGPPASGGAAGPRPGGGRRPSVPPAPGAIKGSARHRVNPLAVEALRAKGLRSCLVRAARRAMRQRSRAGKGCLKRYGRTPARVSGLRARAVSSTEVVLSFTAPGSDGPHPPAAHAYLIKQSRRPIRRARDFRRAQTLCHGTCRFAVTAVGTSISLTITHLRPHSTFFFAIAARDNVSNRPGPRSATAQIRTR